MTECYYCTRDLTNFEGVLHVASLKGSIIGVPKDLDVSIDDAYFCDSMCLGACLREMYLASVEGAMDV